MSNPKATLARWREHLERNETALAGGGVRRRWIHAMYIRLFRFLLRSYGEGNWRAAEAPAPLSRIAKTAAVRPDDPSEKPLATSAADTDGAVAARGGAASSESGARVGSHQIEGAGREGRPARTGDEIRATLKTVHGLITPPPRGHHIRLKSNDWIAVAALSGACDPGKCQALLAEHGIVSRMVEVGDDRRVEVSWGQYEAALAVIRNSQPSLRVRRTKYNQGVVMQRLMVVVTILVGTALLVSTATYTAPGLIGADWSPPWSANSLPLWCAVALPIALYWVASRLSRSTGAARH